ncbi:hypothetical protein GCM10010376_95800 [Streptomyces violaceusniger]
MPEEDQRTIVESPHILEDEVGHFLDAVYARVPVAVLPARILNGQDFRRYVEPSCEGKEEGGGATRMRKTDQSDVLWRLASPKAAEPTPRAYLGCTHVPHPFNDRFRRPHGGTRCQ